MSFSLGVNSKYRHRMPLLADTLHVVLPNMFPSYYDVNRPKSALYFLGKLLYTINGIKL